MINGKEALEKIRWRYVNDPSFQEWCDIVLQDLDKLDRYKQLEKELGIDLFILFGALRNGIYYKSFDGDINYFSNRVLTLSYSYGFDIWVTDHRKFDGLLIDFKDYGKTWALAREELENEIKKI